MSSEHPIKRLLMLFLVTGCLLPGHQFIWYVEKGKIDTLNTHIHGRSLPRLGTGTSIKRGGVLLTQTQSLE
jgi:hypothetical protein